MATFMNEPRCTKKDKQTGRLCGMPQSSIIHDRTSFFFYAHSFKPKKKKTKKDKYQPGRWWRLINQKGELKAETSSRDDILRFYKEGDTIERLYIRTDSEWREKTLGDVADNL